MAQPHQILKTMTRKEIRQFAVAVFFLFATIGPLTLLMEPEIFPGSWFRFIILTIMSGSFSAGIILLMEKPIRLLILIVFFISFQLSFNYLEKTVFLSAEKKQMIVPDRFFKLTQEEMDDMTTKRIVFGFIAVGCIVVGCALFIRVIGKENKRRAQAEAEIKVAQSIHDSLLPDAPLKNGWCEIAGVSIPATQIGGDFFDTITLSDSEALIVVADASGHGIGAGILSAMTKSGILQELQHSRTPAKILERVNAMVHFVTGKNMFVTCALLLLNKETSTATLTTAGHPAILRHQHSAATIEEFRTHNLALGMQHHTAFDEIAIPFSKGDSFYIITDGLIEGSNPAKEQFGIERLKELILDTERSSAEHVSASLIASIREFTISKEFQDDATIIVAQV